MSLHHLHTYCWQGRRGQLQNWSYSQLRPPCGCWEPESSGRATLNCCTTSLTLKSSFKSYRIQIIGPHYTLASNAVMKSWCNSGGVSVKSFAWRDKSVQWAGWILIAHLRILKCSNSQQMIKGHILSNHISTEHSKLSPQLFVRLGYLSSDPK